jgi:hypothetical protein
LRQSLGSEEFASLCGCNQDKKSIAREKTLMSARGQITRAAEVRILYAASRQKKSEGRRG